MKHSIIWIIRFSSIRFILTCCVIMVFYALKVTYEYFTQIEPIVVKNVDKLLVKNNDIPCYYMNDEDMFNLIEDQTFSPKDNSIFFIETGCNKKMSMLQACVIESAAIVHPESKIYILFSFSITESLIKGYFEQVLSNYPNVYASRIHIVEYTKGTVFESILANYIKQRRRPVKDIMNILKVVTLYKWGGIVLDNDMLVISSFEDLPKNWVVKTNNGISTGILSFGKDDLGKNITSDIMKELAKNYAHNSRLFNSLDTIVFRVLKKTCPNLFSSKSGECNGLKVLSEDLFYPIHIPSPMPYLDESTESVEELIPHTFHIKNKDYSSYPSEEWPSESLARIFCPRVFEFRSKMK